MPGVTKPRVLSIGCGRYASIFEECTALRAYFGEGNFQYIGIDVIEHLPEDIGKLQNEFKEISIIQKDANDISELKKLGILPNTMNLVILRHPCFHVEQYLAFKKIVQETIPYFLVTGGKLLVSVFEEQETTFLVEQLGQKSNFDVAIMKMRYSELKAKVLESSGYCVSDKYMYCFANKANSTELVMEQYVTGLPSASESLKPLKKIIEVLGGKFDLESGTFTCGAVFQIDKVLALSHFKISPAVASVVAKDSPVLSPLHEIRRQLSRFSSENTKPFFDAFDAKQYNKALRIVCNSDLAVAQGILDCLIKYKEFLSLDPNETAGEKKLNAFHYAAMKSNSTYQKLLLIANDLGTPDQSGKKPADYNLPKDSPTMQA